RVERNDTGQVVEHRGRAEARERVERARHLAGLADRAADAERADERRENAVLRQVVGEVDLRVRLEAVVVTESAVAVDADADRREQAIVPGKPVLGKE